MPPSVQSFDHLVLTVGDIGVTCAFYESVLGMTVLRFEAADGTLRVALRFGAQKINLHQAGAEFEPKARAAAPGSADLCFLSDVPLDSWLTHLDRAGIPVIEGPVARSGAEGPLMSVYIRDPDGNLLEISNRA
jgi:catechol 2,3-dioxygenase-like lactoylglutathione lyase family enzyme